MKTDTREKIHAYIQEKGRVTPNELKIEFKLSGVSVHRHLKILESESAIIKRGKPPKVFYLPYEVAVPSPVVFLPHDVQKILDQNYLYITPDGSLMYGTEGFVAWARKIPQKVSVSALADEYVSVRKKADSFFQGKPWIDATQKLQQTFPDTPLSKVVYSDFYALPKFGKTKLGALTLHAKTSQNQKLIEEITALVREGMRALIQEYKIDTIAFIPHSVPRKLPFLDELRRLLQLDLQELQLEKTYPGELRIAQKSLSKLEERVENARKTIFLARTTLKPKRILLIDDAVGSGSTLDQSARKIKTELDPEMILGFAVVGSYKGFEVIQEV